MKIQVSFNYNSVPYKFTIDENDIDMTHYDDIWDYWIGENDNELNGKRYVDKDEEHELIFEFTSNKVWIEEKQDYIISGDEIYVNVYENTFEDDYCDQIIEDIEVLYA